MAQHAPLRSAAPTEQHVTVETLIAEPLFQRKLIGGEAGLDRAVTWCLPLSETETSTALRGSPSARSGDLAGVAVHVPAAEFASPERARALVTELNDRGAPMIFAWPRSKASVDLSCAIRTADARGIPLLKLSTEGDYQCVGRLIATKVLAHAAHVLEYSVRVHQTLGEVFAQGCGLQALTEAMATLSQTPVLVADADGEVLSSVSRYQEYTPEELADIARGLRDRLEIRSAEERRSAHGRTHDVVVELGSTAVHAVSAPVSIAGDPYGLVAVLATAASPDPHSLAQYRIAAEQGAALIAAEMLRQRSVREAEERAHDDFVDALVHGRFASPHELAARSRHHRFDTKGRHAVLVVSASALDAERRFDAQRLVSSARPPQDSAEAGETSTLAAQIGSVVIVVWRLPVRRERRGDPLDEQQAIQRYARELHRVMRGRLGEDVRIAYGRPADSASGVTVSYREARTTLGLAERVGDQPVCGYDDLRAFAVIQDLAISEQGREFSREILNPLRGDDQAPRLDEILLAYIAESGNLNATARRLHLHRNTMLYKLDRASRALGMDVRQANTQFLVWLAHHIDTLNMVTRSLDAELSAPN